MAAIKVGIVGTGGMANHHADQFAKIKGAKVVSCYDVVAERASDFAKRHSIKAAASSVDELVGDVDAVVVTTSDRYHAPISLQALKAGKHLLCEKPLTLTLADAKEVANAALDAGRNGAIHMVNFSYRSSPALQKARELVAEGALGEIRHVHSYYLQSWLGSTHWGSWTTEGMLWRLSTAAGSGGVLGDLGCHILDLTTSASEDLAAVRCTLKTFPKITPDGKFVTEWQGRQLDANDTAVIELALNGGGTGLCHTSRWGMGHTNSLRCEVHGTLGALVIDLDKDSNAIDLCLGEQRHKPEWQTQKLAPTPTNYERFITAIQSGVQDQPDVVRGAQVQAYLDACERSVHSQSWETIAAWV